MWRAALGLVAVGLLATGILLIWSGHEGIGVAAVVCAGAAAGVRQAADSIAPLRILLTLGGFLVFLAGGFLLYAGHASWGILVTLLAIAPWCLGRPADEPNALWTRLFSFVCLAFWTFGAACLFKGEALVGGILLAGSVLPWYAMESARGGRVILSLTLLGEVAAWCAAVAAFARERPITGAALLALFLISRLLDDYLLVRAAALAQGGLPLSFRSYLNLSRSDAARLRSSKCQAL
jgi:hypothetical protein